MLTVILYMCVGVAGLMVALMAYQLQKAYRHFKAPRRTSSMGAEVDLPSVSVCIPARNEQHALTECLERVVASKYEKLEIIVLDDVSGDDTSILIKSFAHAGVRFVKGAALPSGWLGKNHALQGLLNEASGSYLFFMDVDTRITPDAIENLVRYALSEGASMVSVLPRREDGWRWSVVASPLRYFWELIFHRAAVPASSSNAWLVRRTALTQLGGFEPYKNAIQPEAQVASHLDKSDDYRFLIGSEHFGIGFEKKWPSQLVTSIRLLFPLLRKDFILVGLAVIDSLILLSPFAIVLTALFMPIGLLHGLAALVALASIVLYGTYTKRVWKKGWLVGALLWPLILIQEVALIISSAVQYKRRTVTWKGRVIRPEAQS